MTTAAGERIEAGGGGRPRGRGTRRRRAFLSREDGDVGDAGVPKRSLDAEVDVLDDALLLLQKTFTITRE